jgi:hypothetical protein
MTITVPANISAIIQQIKEVIHHIPPSRRPTPALPDKLVEDRHSLRDDNVKYESTSSTSHFHSFRRQWWRPGHHLLYSRGQIFSSPQPILEQRGFALLLPPHTT